MIRSWRLCLGVILLDQMSKFCFIHFLPGQVFFNQGIAFGWLPSKYWLAVNLLIISFILVQLQQGWPKSLILGGGLANLIDRIFRGQVVDFLSLGPIPVFNLADLAISLGFLALIAAQLDLSQGETGEGFKNG